MTPPKPTPEEGEGLADDEDAAIERIRGRLELMLGPPPPGESWIGDDAAVVHWGVGLLVLATDAAVAGVHADLRLVGLDDLGWKGLTAAVSDIGAMGARPRHALVTFALPPGTDVDLLNRGVAEAAAAWSCPVVGGDLVGADQVMVSVAVTGALSEGPPAVSRAGASPGDTLFVTGPLGASAAGLRVLRRAEDHAPPPGSSEAALVDAHRRPRARIDEGVTARLAGAGALIDVSDGLSLDLYRLAAASGVGVQLDDVPQAAGATLLDALGGGEDYELIVATAEPDRLVTAFADAGLRRPSAIGVCTEDPAERSLAGEPLARVGWRHHLA